MVSGYLWTKSVSAGLFLAGLWFLPTIGSGGAPRLWRLGLMLALGFLTATTVLLVADLKRLYKLDLTASDSHQLKEVSE